MGDASLPPVGVQFLRWLRPRFVRFPRNLPFLPLFLERAGELLAQRLQHTLPLVPDDVDLSVVGDGLEGDVRHAFVDESEANVAVNGLRTRRSVGYFGLLELAFAGISQQVIRVAR